jgi:hypothetical protein
MSSNSKAFAILFTIMFGFGAMVVASVASLLPGA